MHGDVRKLTFDEVFFSIAREIWDKRKTVLRAPCEAPP
jgi:hypothetical protein